jgi:hypothetical protein
MKKKIINGLLFAVALVAATSSFVSCKDYEGDNYAEFQEKYATLLEAYNAQVKAMQDYVLTARYNQEVGANYDVSKGTVKDRLDNLEKDTAALADRIQKTKEILEQRLKDLEKDTASLAARIQKNNELLGLLSNSVTSMGDTLNHFVFMWGDNLADAYKNAGKAKEIALSYDADTAAINDAIKHAQEIADKAWEYVNKGQAVDKNGETKEDFQAWVKYFEAADNDLADDIDDLNDEVDDILERLGALEEAYKAKVDGVIVQEVRNPIFGTYAYPVGLETNILAAYYGKVTDDIIFPAGDGEEADYWVGTTPVATTDELRAIGIERKTYGGTLFDEYDGNAGRIAMTINPTDIDVTGKNFALATFTGNISKVELSGLEPATEDLYFGHRAAASNNGAYYTYAKIKKSDVEALSFSLNLNESGIKDQFKKIINDWKSTSASDIAKLGLGVFQVVDNAKTLKLGLQTTYKDPVKGWTSSYFDADIAAMSIRPLNFDSFDGLYQKFSTPILKLRDKLTAKERSIAHELLNDIVSVIKVEIGMPEGGENIEVDGDQIYMVIPANKVTISGSGNVTVDANKFGTNIPANETKLPFTVEASNPDKIRLNITPLYNAIKKGIENSIDKIDEKAGETAGKYLTKLTNAQNKFLNKIAAIVEDPSRYVQPALLAYSSDLKGYFYPSRDFWAPTQIKSNTTIKLYPTTLTGEVIVPAYKKYVAVLNGQTNVAPFNTILSGNEFNINKPMELKITAAPGTVLEIIYECLGYNGKVAGKKYYIEVY